jgi:hypothetical protein
VNNLYRYLATLPADPAALRHVILANNHADPAAAFRAIMGLLDDYPLPARFQAELYAVLTGLPGVRFDRSATDFVGRHGIGLYMIQTHFWKMEIIINPRTYTYMGVLVVAVKTHTEYGRHVRKGQIQAWNAMLGSGVVQKGRPAALTDAGGRCARRRAHQAGRWCRARQSPAVHAGPEERLLRNGLSSPFEEVVSASCDTRRCLPDG